jgi:hypothetical protein
MSRLPIRHNMSNLSLGSSRNNAMWESEFPRRDEHTPVILTVHFDTSSQDLLTEKCFVVDTNMNIPSLDLIPLESTRPILNPTVYFAISPPHWRSKDCSSRSATKARDVLYKVIELDNIEHSACPAGAAILESLGYADRLGRHLSPFARIVDRSNVLPEEAKRSSSEQPGRTYISRVTTDSISLPLQRQPHEFLRKQPWPLAQSDSHYWSRYVLLIAKNANSRTLPYAKGYGSKHSTPSLVTRDRQWGWLEVDNVTSSSPYPRSRANWAFDASISFFKTFSYSATLTLS